MNTRTPILAAIILFAAMHAQQIFAQDKPAPVPQSRFPHVGQSYVIRLASPRHDEAAGVRVTILERGEPGWFRVKYTPQSGPAPETTDLWLNFAHVVTITVIPPKPETAE